MSSRKRLNSHENSRIDGDTPKKPFLDTGKVVAEPTPSNLFVKTITREANENSNIRDAIAIDIGTSKCRISICKDRYIQIAEHESSRSVPSYVALSEQNEWLVGRMAENYAVCLQNVIYDIRWLLTKTNDQVRKAEHEKRYFFKRIDSYNNEPAIFDMIKPYRSGPLIVNANEMFEKLLDTLFSTAYKNLQHPTTIAITVPIKSEDNYKKLVKDYTEGAMKRIVGAVSFSTTKQNQSEDQPETKRSRSDYHGGLQQQEFENQTKLQDNFGKRTPLDNITVKLIDEPIAVAAAYASRLNLHPKGNAVLVFCMGAGYLQVATYFIQQRKANYWADLIIAQISGIEPIVVNFAGDDIDRLIFEEMMKKLTQQNGGTRPKISTRAERRLKIACEKMKCALSFAPHTRIDVDSLYRSGDEDCDLVAVIQKDEIVEYYRSEIYQYLKIVAETYRDLNPKFILLAGGSTRLPVITEYLTNYFKGSTICNFLNVDEVAANGAAAIVSKTIAIANEYIDYKQVVRIIKEQEDEEEKRRNPPPISTPIEIPTPTNNIPISSIANKRYVGDYQYPGAMVNNAQYNPTKEPNIQHTHTSQDNRPEQPNIPYSQHKWSQPVSLPGSCSSDPRDKRDRNEKSNLDVVDDMQNREAEASGNIRRNSSSRRSHKKDSINHQSERQSDRTNIRTFENTNFPHTDIYYSNKPRDEITFPNLDKAPKSPGPNYYQNVQSLPSSNDYTYYKTERVDPAGWGIQEQRGQPLSRITDQMKYSEGLSYGFDRSGQPQSLRNNPHNYSQSPTYLSSGRNMQPLPLSDDYPYRGTERTDPMRSKIPEQYNQPSSRNTDKMQHYERPPYGFDYSAQSQSLKTIRPEKSQPSTYLNNDRNMQYLPSSDDYPYYKTERVDPMKSKISEQYNQPSPKNTVKIQYDKRVPDRFDYSAQSQSLKNNPHNKPQPHTYPSSNIEIGPNSRYEKSMLPTSMVENRGSGRRRHNSVNDHLCGCTIL